MRISDWSSDVCSSDLTRCDEEIARYQAKGRRRRPVRTHAGTSSANHPLAMRTHLRTQCERIADAMLTSHQSPVILRSEERSVGKECVSTSRTRRTHSTSKKQNTDKNNKNIKQQ